MEARTTSTNPTWQPPGDPSGHRADVRLTTRGRIAVISAFVLVVAAVAAGGWMLLAGKDTTPAGAGGAPGATAPPPVVTSTSVVNLTGTLPAEDRKAVRTAVADTLDSWWQSAYLGGDWPRSPGDVDASDFEVFTDGAARAAAKDKDQLSNATLGEQITAIEPIRQEATLDIFAPKGKAVGVDVRFTLVFNAVGPDRKVRVNGTVVMTPDTSGAWKIFDYRVGYASTPMRSSTGSEAGVSEGQDT